MIGAFHIQEAITAAIWAQAAYCKTPLPTGFTLISEPPGGFFVEGECQLIDLLPVADVQCLVIREPDRVTFAFRGTDDNRGWMKDAEIEFHRYALPGGFLIGIHSGFFSTVDAIFSKLSAIATQSKSAGRSIFVTGHSKGAAECAVFACRLFWEVGIRAEPIYDFGQPRVFNREGAAAFERTGLTLWRVIDEADVVCRIPLATMSSRAPFLEWYYSVGQTAFFDRWGNLEENEPSFAHIISDIACIVSEAKRHQMALVNDHSVALYIDRLNAYTKMIN